jgi:DNA-binding transcriptional regulator YdaS (Cro superfamily)
MEVVMSREWPQLDPEALALMQAWLAQNANSRAALARHLGVSRSGVSQALDGRYPGDTRHLRALAFEKLAHAIHCPHLRKELSPVECRQSRERSLSEASASRTEVKHWQACQACLHNPRTKTVTQEEQS